MLYTGNAYNWDQVFQFLQSKEIGTIFRFPKHFIDHPIDMGAHYSTGLPMGQECDYRWVLSETMGLHVRDFGTHYEAHIDELEPEPRSFIKQVQEDAPAGYVLGTAAIGALLGTALGESAEGAFVGGIIGALFGAVTLQDSDE